MKFPVRHQGNVENEKFVNPPKVIFFVTFEPKFFNVFRRLILHLGEAAYSSG